jgi:hypothetical protein
VIHDRRRMRAGAASWGLAAAVIGYLDQPAFATPFGSFRLKSGEAAEFQAGPRFLNLRVCNDVASSGSIIVEIGDGASRKIGPGECTDGPGDRIRIQNRAEGEVAGIFQPFFNGRGRR